MPIINTNHPINEGRSSPARSKAFHCARYASDFGRAFRERGTPSPAATHKGRTIISQQQFSFHGYIQEFEAEFEKKLEESEDTVSIVRWVSEKVLESYRNGITAGQTGAKVICRGESRRRGASRQSRIVGPALTTQVHHVSLHQKDLELIERDDIHLVPRQSY